MVQKRAFAMSNVHILFRDTAFQPEQLAEMGKAFDLVHRAAPECDKMEIAAAIHPLNAPGKSIHR